MLQQCGDRDAAGPLLGRALAVSRRFPGRDSLDYAGTLEDRGFWLGDCGDNVGAMKDFQGVLAIRERTLGPDHPRVAWSLSNVA